MMLRSNEAESPRTFAERVDDTRRPDAERVAVREGAFEEWDRSEWVGEGQEPAGTQAHPGPAETEPRWTKWEWVGEGQGGPEGAPRRTADEMPEGANALSGNRHNPGMAHWGGTRFGRRGAA